MAHDPMDDSRNGSSPATGRVDYRRIEVVEPEMAAILRGKTIAQRLEIVQQAHRAASSVIAMGVRLQHPAMVPADVDREVARRLLGGTG